MLLNIVLLTCISSLYKQYLFNINLAEGLPYLLEPVWGFLGVKFSTDTLTFSIPILCNIISFAETLERPGDVYPSSVCSGPLVCHCRLHGRAPEGVPVPHVRVLLWLLLQGALHERVLCHVSRRGQIHAQNTAQLVARTDTQIHTDTLHYRYTHTHTLHTHTHTHTHCRHTNRHRHTHTHTQIRTDTHTLQTDTLETDSHTYTIRQTYTYTPTTYRHTQTDTHTHANILQTDTHNTRTLWIHYPSLPISLRTNIQAYISFHTSNQSSILTFNHPFIHLSATHPFVHPVIHSSSYPCIHLFMYTATPSAMPREF